MVTGGDDDDVDDDAEAHADSDGGNGSGGSNPMTRKTKVISIIRFWTSVSQTKVIPTRPAGSSQAAGPQWRHRQMVPKRDLPRGCNNAPLQHAVRAEQERPSGHGTSPSVSGKSIAFVPPLPLQPGPRRRRLHQSRRRHRHAICPLSPLPALPWRRRHSSTIACFKRDDKFEAMARWSQVVPARQG